MYKCISYSSDKLLCRTCDLPAFLGWQLIIKTTDLLRTAVRKSRKFGKLSEYILHFKFSIDILEITEHFLKI